MSLTVLNTPVPLVYNAPPSQAGRLGDVYYTLLNGDGTTFQARTNTGVVEYGGGAYGVKQTFTSLLDLVAQWDIDGEYKSSIGFKTYDFGTSGDLNTIKTDVAFIKAIEGGRWKIVSHQMIFYDDDNTTEIARFDLFDITGDPANESVFERVRV